jgi:hypothetical protein
MAARYARLIPLVGVIYVGLMVSLFTTGSTPDVKASPAKVISFYTTHHSSQQASVYLLAYSGVFVLLFFGVLASFLRRHGETTLATMTFGGAVLYAAGLGIGAGITATLVDHTSGLSASSAQTLNYLSNDAFAIPTFVGLTVTLLAAGVAVLRSKALPTWLGWVTVVIGVAAATGVGSWPALMASGVWTLVVVGFLIRRADTPDEIALPDIPAARGATKEAQAPAQA